jgi:hypothetical protein
MTSFTPYTYFQCPCTDTSIPTRRLGEENPTTEEENDEDERTFDPRAPRANYSLYPLEHLLYCEDCHQIRCPRCVLDEIVTWYCPNCLFEVPSSTVKSEGNRYDHHSQTVSWNYAKGVADVHEAASNAQYVYPLCRSAASKLRPRDWEQNMRRNPGRMS